MKVYVINPFGDSSGHSLHFSTKVCQSILSSGDLDLTLYTSVGYDPSYDEFGAIRFKVVKSRVRSTRNIKKNYKSIVALLIFAYVRVFGTARVMLKACTDSRTVSDKIVFHVLGGEPIISMVILFFFKKDQDKVILNVHNADYNLEDISNRFKRFYKALLKWIYRTKYFRHFHRIVVHGEQMKTDFISRIDISKELEDRIDVIKVGIDIDAKKEPRCYNKKILFFGVIRRDKGLEYALEALQQCKDYELTVAGAPKEYSKEEVEELVAKMHLRDRVDLRLGFVEDKDIEQLFMDHFIVILPYKKSFAAQSVVMTLAIQYGNYIISSHTGQNGFDVDNYGLGKTFESENSQDLVRVLNAIDEKQTVDFRQRKKFISENSWTSIGKKYLTSYKQTLK